MKYKNICDHEVRFRAAASDKNLHIKKVYSVKPGKVVDVPVEIVHGQMKLVEDLKKEK